MQQVNSGISSIAIFIIVWFDDNAFYVFTHALAYNRNGINCAGK